MDGMPASRIQTGDGGWAYTLYQGGEDGAFVHALDTRTGTAHCIDIPGMTNRDVMGMRLRLTDGGGRLVVRSGARAVAAIDTYTFELVSARSQTQKHRPAPAPSGASSSGTSEAAWGIGIVVVLLAGAGLVGVRRRMPHNPAHGGRS
jgi:hypothetical protein